MWVSGASALLLRRRQQRDPRSRRLESSRMVYPAYLSVLKRISDSLNDSDVAWAVTGSCSLVLQGMEVLVNDVDLQTDAVGAYAIQRALSPYLVKKVVFGTSRDVRSHFGAFLIDGVPVEVMGDVERRGPDGVWRPGPDVRALRVWLDTDGVRVPVLPLTYEYQVYCQLGRDDRAEEIRLWLAERGAAAAVAAGCASE